MRLIAYAAALILISAGCAGLAAPPAPFAGYPALPGTLSPPSTPVPELPGTGPIGRGALLYDVGRAETLLTEDGRHFRLPRPPREEGRQGWLLATLSPDGRWLGHRSARFPGDPRYLIRDLTGDWVVEFAGRPVLWSPDGHFLLAEPAEAPSGEYRLIDPATGSVRPVAADPVVDGQRRHATGILPTGEVVYGQARAEGPGITLIRPGAAHPVDVVFADRPDDECWCGGAVHLSPDGSRAAVLLSHAGGLIPGTSAKAPPILEPAFAVMSIDLDTGAAAPRIELPAGEQWQLLADTGQGLLLRRGYFGDARYTLELLVPGAGAPRVLTELPRNGAVAVPGEVFYTGE